LIYKVISKITKVAITAMKGQPLIIADYNTAEFWKGKKNL
jgi:hypothetical protein